MVLAAISVYQDPYQSALTTRQAVKQLRNSGTEGHNPPLTDRDDLSKHDTILNIESV